MKKDFQTNQKIARKHTISLSTVPDWGLLLQKLENVRGPKSNPLGGGLFCNCKQVDFSRPFKNCPKYHWISVGPKKEIPLIRFVNHFDT